MSGKVQSAEHTLMRQVSGRGEMTESSTLPHSLLLQTFSNSCILNPVVVRHRSAGVVMIVGQAVGHDKRGVTRKQIEYETQLA